MRESLAVIGVLAAMWAAIAASLAAKYTKHKMEDGQKQVKLNQAQFEFGKV